MAGTIQKKRKRSVLITGAAKGLGYELARLYAKAGHALVLVDRNGRRLGRVAADLERIHGVETDAVALDLTEMRSAEDLCRILTEKGLPVDEMVDRAGYRIYGPFSQRDLLRETRMLCAAFRQESAAGVVGRLPLAGLFQTAAA